MHTEPSGIHPESGSTLTPRRALLAGIGGIAAGAVLARGGPLDPPPGPIQSTPGPEPRIAVNSTNTPGGPFSLFRITEPGSYYLAGNITGVAGKHGIEITASGVTLDLNGFDLAGIPGMGEFDGVRATEPDLTDIEVRNGSVRNWGGNGVQLQDPRASNCCIERIRASGNFRVGIRAGFGTTVSGSVAFNNTSDGISASLGSTISMCAAYDNGGEGFSIASGSTISGCTAYRNSQEGILAGRGCTVSGCTAADNTLDGISANSRSMVSQCTAGSNTGNGIVVGGRCTVNACTATENTENGIVASAECFIAGNTCVLNGFSAGDGAGILISFGDNRIEGNHCARNTRGIEIDSPGNMIIRNTCSANITNWDIAAGNAYGPIVATPSGAAVSGDTAVAALGSTDPNANFTF